MADQADTVYNGTTTQSRNMFVIKFNNIPYDFRMLGECI